jgi:hypothetical protein
MRTILLSALFIGASLVLSSALADSPTPTPASAQSHMAVSVDAMPCASSPGGAGNCREYHLGNECGVLAGSVGCHTTGQVAVYNQRCQDSSRWGRACKCK